MKQFEEWVYNPNNCRCPECRNETRIGGFGGIPLGIKCKDHKCEKYGAGGAILPFDHTSKGVSFAIPEEWVVGEPERCRYVCPYCDSKAIERMPYDDGMGFFDVKIECVECGENTWE